MLRPALLFLVGLTTFFVVNTGAVLLIDRMARSLAPAEARYAFSTRLLAISLGASWIVYVGAHKLFGASLRSTDKNALMISCAIGISAAPLFALFSGCLLQGQCI